MGQISYLRFILSDVLNMFYALFEANCATSVSVHQKISHLASDSNSLLTECVGINDVAALCSITKMLTNKFDILNAAASILAICKRPLDIAYRRVLKSCNDQLPDVFTLGFNEFFFQSIVPTCFKSSTIVPVPNF